MNIADLFATLRITPDQRSFDAADRLLEGVKTALSAIATVAGAHVLAGMIEDTVELGSHINDLAQSTGVTTDTLQEMGYAAKLNSSDMDSMASALGKLQNNMHAAAGGGKEQIEAFGKLGVRVTDTAGKLRPVEDVFEDIAINQTKVTNAAEKGVAIFGTLGKSGRALIPTMNDIAQKGMKNIIEEVHALGGVITEEGIAALDEFGDTQDKVKTGLIGLRNQAVVALLPTIQKLADKFLEWIKVNRVLITQKLSTVLEVLVKVLEYVATGVGYVVQALEFLDKHALAVKVSVLGLAAAMLVFKTGSIAAAIASGAAWTLANLPLVLLAALLTAAYLLVEDLIVGFQGGNSVLKEWFKQRGYDWDEFQKTVERVAGAVRDAFKAAFDFIEEKMDGIIGDTIKGTLAILNKLTGGKDSVLDNPNNPANQTKARRDADEVNRFLSTRPLQDPAHSSEQTDLITLRARGQLSDKEFDQRYLGSAGSPYAAGPQDDIGTPITVTGPTVNINVNGNGKSDRELAQELYDKIHEHDQENLNRAYTAVGGKP